MTAEAPMTKYAGKGKKKGKDKLAHTVYGKGFNTIYGPKAKRKSKTVRY